MASIIIYISDLAKNKWGIEIIFQSIDWYLHSTNKRNIVSQQHLTTKVSTKDDKV